MNPTAARTALQPLVSAPARLAGGVAALAILAAGVAFASQASHKAVHLAHAELNPAIVYVTLPTVQVNARRLSGEAMTEVACANPNSRT